MWNPLEINLNYLIQFNLFKHLVTEKNSNRKVLLIKPYREKKCDKFFNFVECILMQETNIQFYSFNIMIILYYITLYHIML